MTRSARSAAAGATWRAALVVAALSGAACANDRARVAPSPARDAAAAATQPGTQPLADPLASLPADGPVVRYAGAFARDPAVIAFQTKAPALAAVATARLRDELDLRFVEGRGPRIVLVDGADAPARGVVSLRLIDGVRRPEIRVSAAAVASGELRAEDEVPGLLAEAAIHATSPERAPPAWLLEGVPPVFSKDTDRRVAALVLRSPTLRVAPGTLAPLAPAFRVAGLQRIGIGERVLARFLAARLGGAGDGAALREVGVGAEDFLDAAAETEAEQALERVAEDPAVRAVRRVRLAVLAGEIAAAEAALGAPAVAEIADPWVEAESRLVRAELAMLRDEAPAAAATLDDILQRRERVLRLADARFLRALCALRMGDATARVRAADFARTHLLDDRTAPILRDLAVAVQDAIDLVSADAATRARAATRMGDAGVPSTAPYLGRSLSDGDAAVRRAVVVSLAKLGAADAVAAVEAATRDADGSVRLAAFAALVALNPDRAASAAKSLATDTDPEVRRAVAAFEGTRAPPKSPPRAPGVRETGRTTPPAAADPPAVEPARPDVRPAPTPPTAPRPAPDALPEAPPPPPAARLPRGRPETSPPPPPAPRPPAPLPPPKK